MRYVSGVLASAVISNFRCIRGATMTFAPLTVLVGANGSGKSSIIDALDPQHRRGNVSTWRRATSEGSTVAITLTSGQTFPHTPGRHDHDRYQFQILHLEPGKLREPNQVRRADSLDRDGGNLANVFASLTRKQQASLSKALCELVPTFADVDIQPTATPGMHSLRFQDRWSAETWYSPAEVSDGTMLLTAFLTLQFQAQPVDVLAIEDPEHALHPYLLGQLVSVLRRLANGDLGERPIQVILSTHSADLLEHLSPEEVRFVSRRPDTGEVVVRAIDASAPHWESAFDEYKRSLGDAWLSGGLGGV